LFLWLAAGWKGGKAEGATRKIQEHQAPDSGQQKLLSGGLIFHCLLSASGPGNGLMPGRRWLQIRRKTVCGKRTGRLKNGAYSAFGRFLKLAFS
jgi:hypothetical protein